MLDINWVHNVIFIEARFRTIEPCGKQFKTVKYPERGCVAEEEQWCVYTWARLPLGDWYHFAIRTLMPLAPKYPLVCLVSSIAIIH